MIGKPDDLFLHSGLRGKSLFPSALPLIGGFVDISGDPTLIDGDFFTFS